MKLKRSLVVLSGILLGLGASAAFADPIIVNITQNVQSTSGLQAATDGSFSQLAPSSINYTINDDFKFFVPGGGGLSSPVLGSVTGLLDSVIDTPTGGCSASDYSGFVAGSIALFGPIQCLFSTQLNLAFAAGAIGGIAQIGELGLGTNNFGYLDPVSIVGIIVTSSLATSLNEQLAVSVPEPGTLALLGIGLFGMGLARRRKKVA